MAAIGRLARTRSPSRSVTSRPASMSETVLLLRFGNMSKDVTKLQHTHVRREGDAQGQGLLFGEWENRGGQAAANQRAAVPTFQPQLVAAGSAVSPRRRPSRSTVSRAASGARAAVPRSASWPPWAACRAGRRSSTSRRDTHGDRAVAARLIPALPAIPSSTAISTGCWRSAS